MELKKRKRFVFYILSSLTHSEKKTLQSNNDSYIRALKTKDTLFEEDISLISEC